jgi:hypothetical protein
MRDVRKAEKCKSGGTPQVGEMGFVHKKNGAKNTASNKFTIPQECKITKFWH